MAKRLRTGLLVATVCLLLTPAYSQETVQADNVRRRSHVPIPSDGSDRDPAQALLKRFLEAQEGAAAHELYRKALSDPKWALQNPDKLKEIAESIKSGKLQLAPNDPLLLQAKKLLESQGGVAGLAKSLSPEQRLVLESVIRANTPSPGGGSAAPGQPETPGQPAPPGDTPAAASPGGSGGTAPAPGMQPSQEDPATSGRSPVANWLLKHTRSLTDENGLLRNTPAVGQAVDELTRLRFTRGTESPAPGIAGLAGRLIDAMPDAVPRGVWSRVQVPDVSKLSLPSMPSIKWPELDLSRTPSPDTPSTGATPGASPRGGGWLWLLGIGALVIFAWQLNRRATRESAAGDLAGSEGGRATLSSWPLPPSAVATPADLIRAFEYLSVQKLGTRAYSWNHRDIAGRLGESGPEERRVAGDLATLYERARYAPPVDILPEEALAAARRGLSYLAGGAPA
jgi:hypothetical protein